MSDEVLRLASLDKRLDPVGATERVLGYLIDKLSVGTYRPGQVVNAARLCQDLGLSKAPIREALRVLAGEGVLIWERNRGAMIRELGDQDLVHLWELFALTIGREISLAACAPRADTDARRLDEALEQIERRARDRDQDTMEFLRSLHVWHSVISDLCPNAFIVPAQVRRLAEFWLPYIERRVDINQYRTAYAANYRRVHDAVLAGDGPTAECAFQYHARWSVANLRVATPR